MATAIGTVKFFNETKGFGFIEVTGLSKDVFFHILDVGEHDDGMIKGATVEFVYYERYHNGEFKNSLESVIAITPPDPESHVGVWAVVKWYNHAKGFGFVILANPYDGEEAFLPVSACDRAEIIPDEGMLMKAHIKKGDKGWKVVCFEAGPEITAESKRASEKPGDSTLTSLPVSAQKPAKKPRAPASTKKSARIRDKVVTDTVMGAAFVAAKESTSVH